MKHVRKFAILILCFGLPLILIIIFERCRISKSELNLCAKNYQIEALPSQNNIKIGIITFSNTHDVGARLQAYAIYRYTRKFANTELINYKRKSKATKNLKSQILKAITPYSILNLNKYEKETKNIHGESLEFNSLSTALKGKYDFVFCGSDQVWNPESTKESLTTYFLDFVSDPTQRIAYAPSISMRRGYTENEIVKIKPLLDKFKCISTRETFGVSKLKKIANKPISVLVDPTLLLDKKDWIDFSGQRLIENPYILIHSSCLNFEHILLANYLAHTTRKTIICVTEGFVAYAFGLNYDAVVNTYGPREFVNLIINADLVFATQYHAATLAIASGVPIAYYNPNPDRDFRVKDLFDRLEMNKNIVDYNTLVSREKHDFSYTKHTQKKLFDEIGKSKAFIRNAIK